MTVLALAFSAGAQGMEFFHGSWEDALEEAEEQGKLIFVDCYTTWCGPCKRMAANTFPDPAVGEFYNANFINVKIDMEKEDGIRFRQKYSVSAYPTLYYIAPDGEVVFMTKGAKQPGDFLNIGQLAVKKYDGSAQYKEMYDSGDHSYETVYNYIDALNRSNKSSLKVANEYFRDIENIDTPENLSMLMVATTRVDSRIFEYFEEYKDKLVKMEGEDAVAEVVRRSVYNTGMAGIEYESLDLLDEAHAAIKKHLPDEADEFYASSRMQYALKMEDLDLYSSNCKDFIKKYAEDNPEELRRVAEDIMKHFPDNEECISLGLKAAKKAAQLQPTEETVIVYATMVFLDGNRTKALDILDEALEDPNFSESKEKLKIARKQLEAA